MGGLGLKLLLDTHIWIWSLLEPERLVPSVQLQFDDAGTELWLSPISVWETLMLAEKGRIRLTPSPADWVAAQLRLAPMREAPLTREVAVESRRVDVHHQDPADRFLAATAIVHGLTLVTADALLLASPTLPVLANSA